MRHKAEALFAAERGWRRGGGVRPVASHCAADQLNMSIRSEDSVDRVVRVVSTIATGLFFGGALYINVVHVPGLKLVSGSTLVAQFSDMFNRAKVYGRKANVSVLISPRNAFLRIPGFLLILRGNFFRLQGGAAVVAAAALLGNYFGRGKRSTDEAIAGALAVAIVPFTQLVMMPTIREIMGASPSEANANSAHYADLVGKWNVMHAVRTVLSLGSLLVLTLRPLESAK